MKRIAQESANQKNCIPYMKLIKNLTRINKRKLLTKPNETKSNPNESNLI